MPWSISTGRPCGSPPSSTRSNRPSDVETIVSNPVRLTRGARVHHARAARERSAQAHRDPHPVRPPFLGELFKLRHVRLARQSIYGADRTEQARFGRRQLVHRAQRAQPDELRAKFADSLQALERCERVLTLHRPQRFGVKVARQRGPTQLVEVLDLAPEQSLERPQLDERFGPGKAVQAMTVNVDRGAELAAHLLFDALALTHGDSR